MSKNDIRFTDEFKQQIVELYRSGQSVSQSPEQRIWCIKHIHLQMNQTTFSHRNIRGERNFSQGIPSNAKACCRVGNGM